MPPFITLLATESGLPLSRADDRVFAPGVFRWMPPPLTAHMMTKIDGGHYGAHAAARATELKRVPVSALAGLFPAEDIVDAPDAIALVAIGEFSETEPGVEAAQLVAEQTVRRVSVQPRAIWVAGDCRVEGEDDDGWTYCDTSWDVFTDYQVAGFTILDTPGMESGVIRIADDADLAAFAALDDLGPAGNATWEFRREIQYLNDADAGLSSCALVAAGIDYVQRDADTGEMIASIAPVADSTTLPAAAFAHPPTADYRRVQITAPDDQGWRHMFGYVAPLTAEAAEECHLDFPGMCKLAPRCGDEFPWFHSSMGVPLDDGTVVWPGTITLGGPHAPLSAAGQPVGMQSALAHYSDRSTGAAYVMAQETERGVWISGVVKRDLTEDQFIDLCCSKLSIDYRPVAGSSSLAGVHAVNTPGFIVPLVASIASHTDDPGIIFPGERPIVDLSAGASDPVLLARVEALEARLHVEDTDKAQAARDLLADIRLSVARDALAL